MCRSILASIEKGASATAALRQTERLARLIDDPFMLSYAEMALQPRPSPEELRGALAQIRANRDAEASGKFRYFEDFSTGGVPLGRQLATGNPDLTVTLLPGSVPEAETFVHSARKRVKYTIGDRSLLQSVEEHETVIERVVNRVHRYATSTLNRLLFEEVPERVLEETRKKVDQFLAANSPAALEKFRIAYEELTGGSSENWTNACTAVRRILLDVADALFPPKDEPVDGRRVGQQDYKNRLWAYAKSKIASESQRQTVIAELEDLGNRVDAIYIQSNKGVHAVIGRDEAERIIVRAYLLIADLI